MSLITKNWQVISETINSLAHESGRNPQEIQLLAVSKNFGLEAITEAMQAGQHAFGENYLQEALEKMQQLKKILSAEQQQKLQWHFIGPIQSNKTRAISEHFSWVHSVDREKIAQRLSEQRPAHLANLQVCIQVNIDDEASKSGVAPQDALALALQIKELPRLTLRGLMAVPAASNDELVQRRSFKQLRELKNSICLAMKEKGIKLDAQEMQCLSMGMSADLPAAIAEGSTIVRVGSGIFGKRTYA